MAWHSFISGQHFLSTENLQDIYRRWLKKANRFEEDALDNLNKRRYDLACFAAQQASELRLKGLLIKITGTRPYTHLLSELVDALKESGIEVP